MRLARPDLSPYAIETLVNFLPRDVCEEAFAQCLDVKLRRCIDKSDAYEAAERHWPVYLLTALEKTND